MKKILLAIDSYKGCLSSKEVETCVEQALHARFPDCKTRCFPIADGGEGLLDALTSVTDMQIIQTEVHNPLMRIRNARYGILKDKLTAIIEMSEASGLTLLNVSERNPMRTSTFGTGELILNALQRGCRNFLIGIGGSATNDAGMGMLEALGVRFYDEANNLLHASGETMCQIAHVDISHMDCRLQESVFQVACDVNNPFCGIQGAAHAFGPQKGATHEQIKYLDEGMHRFATSIHHLFNKDIMNLPGAGAAGGLGGTLYAFLHAKLVPGIDLILNATGFDNELANTDWVITGEGKSDAQTLMGKVPLGILRHALREKVPVCLLSGKIEERDILQQAGFSQLIEVSPADMPLAEAMDPDVAKRNLHRVMGSFIP